MYIVHCYGFLTNNLTLSPSFFTHQAANGHEECVDALLQTSTSHISTRDINGRTPLHMAAVCGHVGILATLLQAGCTNHIDNWGYTPLHWACYNGKFGLHSGCYWQHCYRLAVPIT